MPVQLYCMAFELLDREWLRLEASYMEFPKVLATVKKQCEAALQATPESIEDLRRSLLA